MFVPRLDATYYERCFCVCVCACHPEHKFVKLNDSIPHFLRISKAPRAAHQAAVQHHHRTSHWFVYMGAPVFPLCNLRHPQDLKSTTSRRGALQPMYQIHSWVALFKGPCDKGKRRIRDLVSLRTVFSSYTTLPKEGQGPNALSSAWKTPPRLLQNELGAPHVLDVDYGL